MKYTPCEQVNLKGLSSIRREIATSMLKDFGIKQREVADMLEITPAAVCQYISKKRGYYLEFDEEIQKEIRISAERVYKYGNKYLSSEICRICKIVRKNNVKTPILEICEE